MFALESMVWFVIPIIFFLGVSRIFKFITKKNWTGFFVFLTLFSFTFYFYRPRLGCVYDCAIFGRIIIYTIQMAFYYNFIFFLSGLIVALVFNWLISKITKGR